MHGYNVKNTFSHTRFVLTHKLEMRKRQRKKGDYYDKDNEY